MIDPLFLKTVSVLPGVYKMLNAAGEVLYVGKAKNLKKRLSSYFHKKEHDLKTQSLLTQVQTIQTTITLNEIEALILENQWIKSYHPRYNILFRDDKSYPYIFISDDPFPAIRLYRGPQRKNGAYFGPYPHTSIAKEKLHLIQKIFRLHHCKNTMFRTRHQPCLQHQIHLCSGACAGLISKEEYAQDVHLAKLFLAGHHTQIIAHLQNKMKQAAQKQHYEIAAHYRDQIQLLQSQEKQPLTIPSQDRDIIAIASKEESASIALISIRHGTVAGHHSFFAHLPDHHSASAFSSFIAQYYLDDSHPPPHEIIINLPCPEKRLLQKTLSTQAHHQVYIKEHVKGMRADWLKMACLNAEQALTHHLTIQTKFSEKWHLLQQALHIQHPLHRIECFDISHTFGEATIASCIVFDSTGPLKKEYRYFNITGVIPGDDIGAMQQAFLRRYHKIKHTEIPEIILIDGGQSQLNRIKDVAATLFTTPPLILAIAKGSARKSGQETIYSALQNKPLALESSSAAFRLIQYIRDEAHRFAIIHHRKKRAKTRQHSTLEAIVGIGPKRRQQLLQHFGGLQGIQKASLFELQKIKGISLALAKKIYAQWHVPDYDS